MGYHGLRIGAVVVQQPQGSAQTICAGPNLAAPGHHNQREPACRSEQLVPANTYASPKHTPEEVTHHECGKAAAPQSCVVFADSTADASCGVPDWGDTSSSPSPDKRPRSPSSEIRRSQRSTGSRRGPPDKTIGAGEERQKNCCGLAWGLGH